MTVTATLIVLICLGRKAIVVPQSSSMPTPTQQFVQYKISPTKVLSFAFFWDQHGYIITPRLFDVQALSEKPDPPIPMHSDADAGSLRKLWGSGGLLAPRQPIAKCCLEFSSTELVSPVCRGLLGPDSMGQPISTPAPSSAEQCWGSEFAA